MSRTLVQRFYEVAKLKAESPALGLEYGGAYHDLPWWFVKSKAKHFGMGLLEAGAREGEYFYLLPSEDPEWIYAELGALTVGLKTLPLPKTIPANALATLFRRFPPAFFFAGGALPPPELFRGLKGLHRILRTHEESSPWEGLPVDSFRRVFNSGIRCEAKHHASFRRHREAADLSTELSPIRVDEDGLIRESALNYGQVNEIAARFDQALGNKPLHRFLAQTDLSHTLDRVAALYWPILKGAQAILAPPRSSFGAWLKRFAPEAILAPTGFLKEIAEASDPAPAASSLRSFADLKQCWERLRLRRRLHLGSLALALHRAEDAGLTAGLARLGIATYALD
ncbi:MAG TPA: hypothetical protein VJP40_08840 [bacterium]|nr:hypothetical protein [bacterium]